ncbi:reverse transcriptase domain-containing protein [Enterobacter kobei]|uniref:reverse transcriptase domain-containing protein n=1 Tax=Enterobacter kobei TaxID=208224 RepID=UPI003D7E01C8
MLAAEFTGGYPSFGFAENTDDLFVGKTLLHGDVLMWLMKTLLTSGCTNQRGAGQLKHVIPYGYPQSPILASLCFHQSFCGSTINTVSKSGHVSVSIFMDDILLSSDDLGQLENAFDIILEAIRRSGYTVNENKTQPPSLMVNVFNLELSQNSLRVTSKRIVEFLQAFISSKNPHERKGIASYVGSINTAQAKLFR